jgi:acetyl esterase/lipase
MITCHAEVDSASKSKTENTTMTVITDIQYSQAAGEKGYGDLYLPVGVNHPRPVLLIHGGAWKSMTRQRVSKVAEFIAAQGYAVFNISYRLLPDAPYPACEEDCIAAAKFLLEGGHPSMMPLDRSRIVVGGLSAGGHLALVTGLKMPAEQIAGIMDISGPTDLNAPELKGLIKFSGLCADAADQPAALKAASPTFIAEPKETLPPLLVLQCQEDGVVDIRQAYRIIEVWNNKKANVQAFLYEGSKKEGHNLWRNGDAIPQLHQKLENQITAFLNTFLAQN